MLIKAIKHRIVMANLRKTSNYLIKKMCKHIRDKDDTLFRKCALLNIAVVTEMLKEIERYANGKRRCQRLFFCAFADSVMF